ncbi:hypothetical protein ACHAWF_015208 [Thalassiosira exigua]
MSNHRRSASPGSAEMDLDSSREEDPSRASSASSSSSSSSPRRIRPSTAAPTPSARVRGAPPPQRARTAPISGRDDGGGQQNVRVVARVRPLSAKELGEGSAATVSAHERLSSIGVKSSSEHNGDANGEGRRFEFDAVFGTDSTQKEVYDRTCGDMIRSSVFRGFNATILAYGQTGSGKTFTMGTDGNGGGGSNEDATAPPSPSEGVIARAVHDLFETRASLSRGDERVKVTMSYLEIYNEQAVDLLDDDPESTGKTLQVRDSRTEGVVIPGLKSFPVLSPAEVGELMARASGRRATGSTHMNSVSSRSHAICTLNVTVAPDEVEGEEDEGAHRSIKAKLTLVDLAGSERAKRTGAEGARMREGININKGLFVLGQVVSALSELGQRNGGGGGGGKRDQHAHIPYRDSKLTRLLQDSLGGNSRTVMIACISPAESNVDESVNTLRYAERTRNIKNAAVRNVISSGMSATEAAALRRENQQLRLQLARMECRTATNGGGGGGGGSGFAFGTILSANDVEMGSGEATQLRAQCTSLLAVIDLLKGRAQGHAQELLEASLRADRWQARSEAVVRLAAERGLELPQDEMGEAVAADEGVACRLRKELAECREEMLEARAEAAVARATAGAILAGKWDAGNVEEAFASSDDALETSLLSKEDDMQKEILTTELSAVSATIEQKEAMVLQMNKERACMGNLQQHFESSLRLLQVEVDAMTAERDELMVKMSSSEKENAPNADRKRRGKRKANDPTTKRMRDQISKLENRIDELKLKAGEHKRSMRMKEEAEKKCARLTAEIAEDKRRRADLQRKLKEASVEMRTQKKAAQQRASKMMKDSQKLRIELSKMKNAADKQAAVLKRKIDQAAAKEKAQAGQERKRRFAQKVRMASSSADGGDVRESRKAELTSWIDREMEYSLFRFQIGDQRRRLDDAVSERKRLIKESGDTIDIEELDQLDAAIQSLRETVADLEATAKKAFPDIAGDNSATSAFRFLDTSAFKALSKPDAKYALSYIFDTCISAKRDMTISVTNQEMKTNSAVGSALEKEKKNHEKELAQIRMEHADVTLNLLESTQGMVNSNMKLKMDAYGAEHDLKEQVDSILESYNTSWSLATGTLKSDLDDIKDTQDALHQMMEKMAKGMAFVPKKLKAKKKKKVEYDSDAFESDISVEKNGDESYVDDGNGEDSDWTPEKKKERKRKAAKVTIPSSPASPIGENFIDDINNKKVQSLRKACKKLGIPRTGKKADLKQRVKETILNASCLNSSAAVPDATEEGDRNNSFDSDSVMKKVVFEADVDDVAVDHEFRPIAEDPTPKESVKKKLWEESDDAPDHKLKPVPSSAAPSKPPPRTPSKMTPCKRKKSPRSDKENSATPKRPRPFGFLTSSPRPLATNNTANRTPVHLKQTISTAKKRLVPDEKKTAGGVTKRSHITGSSKKRTKRGMGEAVNRALQMGGDVL